MLDHKKAKPGCWTCSTWSSTCHFSSKFSMMPDMVGVLDLNQPSLRWATPHRIRSMQTRQATNKAFGPPTSKTARATRKQQRICLRIELYDSREQHQRLRYALVLLQVRHAPGRKKASVHMCMSGLQQKAKGTVLPLHVSGALRQRKVSAEQLQEGLHCRRRHLGVDWECKARLGVLTMQKSKANKESALLESFSLPSLSLSLVSLLSAAAGVLFTSRPASLAFNSAPVAVCQSKGTNQTDSVTLRTREWDGT